LDIAGILYNASIWALPVLIAITFHEAAHGYVAWRLGDDTAYRMGRVTFNPLKHVDPVGTVMLPAVLIRCRSTSAAYISRGATWCWWRRPVRPPIWCWPWSRRF
jgi:Zn-dependent protease